MTKAKAIEKKKKPFELKNAEEAKKIVFKLKKRIMFQETIQCIKGVIIVSANSAGGADFKCQVFPIFSKIAKTIVVPCADEDDFVYTFNEARKKTLAKMDEMAHSKFKPIK